MYYRYDDGVENIYEKIKKYKMIEEINGKNINQNMKEILKDYIFTIK